MLFDDIQKDLRLSLIYKNEIKRNCLRMIISDIKNQTINVGKEITDDICLNCIKKSVRQHQESIKTFKNANRLDLSNKEEQELKYIEKYLPKMLSEDETKVIIDNILNTVEATKKNMGLIMKQLPKEVDKKIASKYLNSILK